MLQNSCSTFPLLCVASSQTTSFANPIVKVPSRQSIALISVHGDPAAEIGQEEAGGQNVYVRQIGEALAKLGWQVDMYTRKASPDAADVVEHSPHCRTIRLKAGPETFIPRDCLYKYLPEFVASFKKIFPKENYPLIHTNYWLSGWVALQLQQEFNLQWLHTYHSLGAVKYRSIAAIPDIAQTRLEVERQILAQADRIVATSPQEQEHIRKYVSKRGSIEVIPCGTDVENFKAIDRETAKVKLGFNKSDRIILYVGRFDPRKGIETLVLAFARLAAKPAHENTHLVIVGGSDRCRADGVEQRRIEQLVQDLGSSDRTHFAGRIGHDRLPLYYSAAEVCAVPSHYEPFGLVAIEAMACGTPVVASKVGGLQFTVLQEETGLLVPPQDEVAWELALDRLLDNPDWATTLGKNAAAHVRERFSWTGVAEQLTHLYRHLLATSLMQEPKKASNTFLSQFSTPIASIQKQQQKVVLAS